MRHLSFVIRLFSLLSLALSPLSLSAAPLGPNPAQSFEGHIDYQANAETLLRCDQTVCDSLGLGGGGVACETISESELLIQGVPEQSPGFRLIYADLSWAASEGVNTQLDTNVTLRTPGGAILEVEASLDRSESFVDGMANCQQLIPLICAEAPPNLSCDLQFYAHHADLTEALSDEVGRGGSLNGSWGISDVQISGSAISDPQTAIAAVGSLTIGAWSLLLVYESPELPSRKIYYYQGLELNEGVNRQLFPRGFIAPPDPVVDLTLMVLEGDQQISGDQLLLNGRQLSDPCNPAQNVFNSTVNAQGECRRSVTGVDLDRFLVEGAIEEGDTEAEIELVIPMGNGLTTSGEQLFTHWLILSFDHLLPTFDQLKPEKYATPRHEQTVVPGEVITYEIRLLNQGEAPATNVILRDPTPQGTEYILGSATVDQLPIDDGPQGSNPLAAGLILTDLPQVGDRFEIGEGHSVQLQVRVLSNPEEITEVLNIAEISADRIDPIATNIVRHPIDLSQVSGGEEAGTRAGSEAGGVESSGEPAGDAGGEIPLEGGEETEGGEVSAGDSGAGDSSAGELEAGEVSPSGASSSGGEERDSESYCGEGTRLNSESGLCESICGPGLRWDAACEPSQCVQESQPPCQESERSRGGSADGCQTSRRSHSSLFILLGVSLLLLRRRASSHPA